ncbi:MAG: PD-(D/E)XK nuclease domain-containing protein [Microscillaceae bacterium]|nr:PD-(D/E)XK nuclease domain-containing protein [Microscillaceae bacterium]
MTTADEALAQIHARKYFEKYLHKQKEIVLVGAAFDEENKTLKEWKSETWTNL